MSQERIDIVITENGMRRVKTSLDDIGNAAKSAESALTLLKRTLGGLAIGTLAKQLIETADAFTNMQNRIRLVAKDQAQLNVITDDLVRSANETRSSLEGTMSIYSRLSTQAKDLGKNQEQLIAFTKEVNEATILSGVGAQQATAGLIQLSQGMAAGVLRGQDLRAVLEDIPFVAQVIAEGMGKSVTQIRKLGAEGKITTEEIFDAFEKSAGKLNELFAKTIPTVSQAMTVLNNQWEVYIGRLNTSTGATKAIAEAILYVANNLTFFGKAAEAVAIVVGTLLAKQALGYLLLQMEAMAVFVAANPFTALAYAALAAAAAVIAFGDQITISDDKLVTLADVGTVVFNELSKGASWLGNQFNRAWEFIKETWRAATGVLIEDGLSFPRAVSKMLDTVILGFKTMGNVIVAVWDRVKAAFTDPTSLHNTMGDTIREAMMKTVKDFGEKGPIENSLDGLLDSARMASNNRIELESARLAAEARAKKQLSAPAGPAVPHEAGKHKLDFNDLIHRLREEGQELRLTGVMREAYNNKVAMETKLKRQLTLTERQLVLEVTQDNHALKDRADILEGLEGNSTKFIEKQTAINALMQEAPGLVKVLNQELAELEINMLQSQKGGTFTDGYVRQMRIMQLETRNAVADMGASFASLFGPGGSLSQGIGDAVAQSVVMGERFDQAMKKVAQSVLTNVISSLVQLGINMALNAALGNALAGAATAASVAEGAAVAAAWAPAAALVNAATFGAGAAAGTTAVTTSMGIVKGLSVVPGFAEGGYTGNAGRGTIAGVVHGQEGVINAAAMSRLGTRNLDRMNSGMSWNQSPTVNVTAINKNVPGMKLTTRQINETDVEIIAEKVLQTKGPAVIASDIGNPGGKVRKSLGIHTTATAKRL